MEGRRISDPERLGDLLGNTYETLAGEAPTNTPPGAVPCDADLTPERMLAAIWPEVVGSEVAANARPVQIRGKRLVVTASSSVWAQTLQFMGAAIAAGINERLGADAVRQIVFRHAGWEERPRGLGGAGEAGVAEVACEPTRAGGAATRPADAALSEEQRAALADVARLDLTPELREKMLRAMRAAFVRGEKDSVR